MQSYAVYRDKHAIIAWLLVCALLVAGMVLVGGYTRLSGSGLSITQWKPIHGVIPPIGEAQWQEEFEAYKATPQYAKVNLGMTLHEFKVIFWPEFIHRVLARVLGIVFFLPLLVFALRRSMSRRFGLRLLGIFALGGAQGLMGWLMVASGLVDAPYVSHLRLAAHLSLAFLIFSLILWALLDLKQDITGKFSTKSLAWYRIWFTMLCVQIVLGAFVAGLHAGLIYNTFPTMNGRWLPDGLWSMEPIHRNLFFNITTIQFLHRWLAVAVAFGFIFWWRSAREYVSSTLSVKRATAVAVIIAVQFTLGVLTLIHQVPLELALAHQMTALLLFTLAVALLHSLTYVRKI